MTITIKPLTFKPPKLRTLSRKHLDTVYEQHYGGVLREHNRLGAQQTDARAVTASEVSLFENYLGALTDEDVGAPSADVAEGLENSFGGVDGWKTSLKKLAKAHDTGWLITGRDDGDKTLVMLWTASRTTVPSSIRVVFALPTDRSIVDIDFTNDTDGYVDGVVENIKWSAINARYADVAEESAVSEELVRSPESVAAALAAGESVRVLDVRQAEDVGAGDVQVKGSQWLDPKQVDEWAGTLGDESDVVVYCMYGAWVSLEAAAALRERGVNARILAGGISSWQALDLDVIAFSPAATESS